MRIKYNLKGISLKNQSLCIGDLIRYYGESKYKLIESVERISENRGITAKMLNAIRDHTKAGMTLEGLITNLQMASGTDIFTFKVNGKDPTELFHDGDIELEIYMNPLYFTTKAGISGQIPGFRRKNIGSSAELQMKAKQEQAKWIKWFEKELNKYHPRSQWGKRILDLDKD